MRTVWIAALAAACALGSGAAANETICNRSHVAGAPEVVMLLWRGPTEVERGVRDYLDARGLAVNVTCLSAERDAGRIPAMVAEAKARDPDLLYTWGTSVTLATVGQVDAVDPGVHVTDTPVIFTMVSYPVGSRIVPESGLSGRNVTGSSHTVPLAAQLRAMRSYRPVSRIGVVFNPLEDNSVLNVRALQALAGEDGIEVIAEPVGIDADGRPDPEGLAEVVAALAAREPQFLYIGPDSFVGDHRETVIGAAIAHGVPAFTGTELEIVDGRAMIGLVTGYYNLGGYMGALMERVLVGSEDPGEIPVSTLSRFTFLLRLDVARQMGLYPPLEVLDFAKILDGEGS